MHRRSQHSLTEHKTCLQL